MMNTKKIGLISLSTALVISGFLAYGYIQMWRDDIIIPGPGVTEIKWLSDYYPDVRGTLADTRIYIMDGEEPGGTFLVFGGTHSDETAGEMAAMILVEYATVAKGRVIVVPQMNNSGWTNNYPQEAHPQFITIPQENGDGRVYRLGSRESNSAELWPDPEVYIQYPHKQKYSGEEARNPNRAWPGRPDGTFNEWVAYAFQQFHRQEHVDMQIDLHEGQPEYPFVNALSAHKRAADVASMAVLEMQMNDLEIGMETSPDSFRGLSNIEMGDMFPDLYALTSETVNPLQGKLRGITDEYLTINGQDAFYDKAAELGYLFAPWPEGGSSLDLRVGRNMQQMQALTTALYDVTDIEIEWGRIPTYEDLVENGVGHYLNQLPEEGIERPAIRALPGFWRFWSKTWYG